MATYLWTGAGADTLWSNRSNWNVDPGAGNWPLKAGNTDTVTVGSSSKTAVTLDVDITLAAGSTATAYSALSFTQNAGTTITVSGGSWMNGTAGSSYWVYNGTLTVTSGTCYPGATTCWTVTVGSTAVWNFVSSPTYMFGNGGSFVGFTSQAGSIINFTHSAGQVNLFNGPWGNLTLAGTINVSGGGTLGIAWSIANYTCTISGTINVTNGTVFLYAYTSPNSNIILSGSIVLNGGSSSAALNVFSHYLLANAGFTITNTGSIVCNGMQGTVTISTAQASNTFTHNGSITINSGSGLVLKVPGTFSGSGTMTHCGNTLNLNYQDALALMTTIAGKSGPY